MTLIDAIPSDENFLFAVYAGARRAEMAGWGWSEAQQNHFLRMQFMARQSSYRARYPAAATSIIRRDGVPVGSMIVAREPEAIVLVDIAILPEHQRTGIGRGLIDSLRAESAGTGRPVRLSVAKGNPAIKLYARSGFSVVSEDEVYLMMEGRPEKSADIF